jgi:hypothetical protein
MKRHSSEPDLDLDEDVELSDEDNMDLDDWREYALDLQDALAYAVILAAQLTGLPEEFFVQRLDDPGQ